MYDIDAKKIRAARALLDWTRKELADNAGVSEGTIRGTRDNAGSKADDAKRQAGAESDSSEPKGQELVYEARIVLDQTQMQVDDRMVNLEPGMAVTAEIKTGSRKIIEYILSPVQQHMHQAMRER